MEQNFSLNRFKNKKLLTQLFTVLLGFSTILMLVISFVVNYQTSRSILERNNLISSNILKVSSQTLDTLFFGYHDSLTHITYDAAVIDSVITPKAQESATNYQTLSVLNGYCQENEAIEEIYLHIKRTDQILTSTYVNCPLEQFTGINLIKNHISHFHSTSLLKSGRTTTIELHDGNIYLIRDFPLGKERSLGTLYMKINPSAIYNSTLSESQTSYSTLLAYDNDWNPLFPDLVDYNLLPDDILATLSALDTESSNTVHIGDHHYFIRSSEQSQISLVLVVDDTYFTPGLHETIKNSIPFLALILVLSILLTVCILYLSYLPILKLTKLVSTDGEEKIPAENELNYIMDQFYKISDKRDELDHLLGSMVPQISKEFYFELLNGKPMELAYISNMLANLDSPLQAEGTFGIVALTFAESFDSSRHEPVVEHLCQLLGRYPNQLCNYVVQQMDKSLYIFIIQYIAHVTGHQITNMEIKLEQLFFDVITTPGQAWFEIGPKCSSLQNLSVSYIETLQRLTQKKYLAGKPASVIDKNDNDSITMDFHYFQIQTKSIGDYIMRGDHELALQKSLQICADLSDNSTAEERYRSFAYYRQAFLHILTAYHIDDTVQTEDAFIFEDNPPTFDDMASADSIREYMERFCITANRLLTDKYEKQQHKYLIKAKQYIDEHYSNPDLSLHLLAEQCGTTASYLSKLFKESFGINFIDSLNRRRIEQAKVLLDTTAKTIGVIAAETGFNSQQNFIRVFKKHAGVTPGQYRSHK